MPNFVAIDFETANYDRDSACAIAAVKVSSGKIVKSRYRLIRPPHPDFVFTYLHKIAWEHVKGEPDFSGVWPEIAELIDPSDLILAHNVSFDRGVLARSCDRYGLPFPSNEFGCTVRLARAVWDIRPTTLDAVCRHLGIELQHHQAESDALACAKIGLAAHSVGVNLSASLPKRARRQLNSRSIAKAPKSRGARKLSLNDGVRTSHSEPLQDDSSSARQLAAPLDPQPSYSPSAKVNAPGFFKRYGPILLSVAFILATIAVVTR